MSGKLCVVFDTTVFCGALVNKAGGNMQCLLMANGPFFVPIISQEVLREFIHSATVRGLGHGKNRRVYTYLDVQKWLNSLAPLLDHSVPVGLRAILPSVARWPTISLGQAIQNLTSQWPAGIDATALPARIHTLDQKDIHVMLAVVEHCANILVTSNLQDYQALTGFCSVESPRQFLSRWL